MSVIEAQVLSTSYIVTESHETKWLEQNDDKHTTEDTARLFAICGDLEKLRSLVDSESKNVLEQKALMANPFYTMLVLLANWM